MPQGGETPDPSSSRCLLKHMINKKGTCVQGRWKSEETKMSKDATKVACLILRHALLPFQTSSLACLNCFPECWQDYAHNTHLAVAQDVCDRGGGACRGHRKER